MVASLHQACIDLAWSQWVALGVSGSAPPPEHPIDLEAAIAFIPALETLDPRLHGEALDWCVRFAPRVISVARLKQIVKLFDSDHQRRFGELAAVVNATARTKWPATPVRVIAARTSQKSRFNIDAPAAVQLRARLVFGISARADLLAAVSSSGPAPVTEAALASVFAGLAYTRRNIAEALSSLDTAKVLSHRSKVFYFERRTAVRELLGTLPAGRYRPWGHWLAVAATLLATYERVKNKPESIRSIELRKAIQSRVPVLEASHDERYIWRGDGDPWDRLSDWLLPSLVA